MRRTVFWKTDWFPGLAISCAMLAIASSDPMLRLERMVAAGATAGATVPVLSRWSPWAVLILVAAYLIVLLPRFSNRGAGLATALLAIVLVAAHFSLMLGAALWIPLLSPLLLLLVGHLLLVAKRISMDSDAGADSSRPAAADRKPSPTSPAQARSEANTRPVDPAPVPDASGGRPDVKPIVLGRYQIEKRLGKGAMGEVFCGRDTTTGERVAIKTLALKQEFAPDELADVRARFFREAETAGRLHHPNIVSILDAGEADDLAFIAMEFLGGTDLLPYTKLGHLLPVPQVAGVVARIAEALAYAHRNNVVHRDVKPANVMYEPASDQVKVMDFGIARITDSSRTKTGMVLGTPSYMSPEQLLGKKVDGRSDLYSLGVMLYQMVCGKLPFVGESMGQLMLKIANEACPDVRTVNPLVPEALAAIIERAVRKGAAERYQTGDEMAHDLRAVTVTNDARPAEVDNEL